jgi:hypothetical protein
MAGHSKLWPTRAMLANVHVAVPPVFLWLLGALLAHDRTAPSSPNGLRYWAVSGSWLRVIAAIAVGLVAAAAWQLTAARCVR